MDRPVAPVAEFTWHGAELPQEALNHLLEKGLLPQSITRVPKATAGPRPVLPSTTFTSAGLPVRTPRFQIRPTPEHLYRQHESALRTRPSPTTSTLGTILIAPMPPRPPKIRPRLPHPGTLAPGKDADPLCDTALLDCEEALTGAPVAYAPGLRKPQELTACTSCGMQAYADPKKLTERRASCPVCQGIGPPGSISTQTS
ncbi:hypothetical protein ACFVYD_16320 [Streptomyces sp. NPDC058301]|uniref:hypothetical protein n=1 Tax=Streptomyces sp. NPDC058301 TaxID=3346436 RepID=UPI0036E1FF65